MAKQATINVTADFDQVYGFVTQYIPLCRSEGQTGLALTKDDEIVCGVVYDDYSVSNIWMHVAALPGRRWLTKESYLRFTYTCFHYPFIQLGVKRVSGWVEASNAEARRFDEHLGFKQEAVLQGAARDGGDVIIYVMHRKDCRYV